jgi:hypothetical protein
MPNSFKPSPRSSFKASNVLLSNGHAMTTGPVVNLHLGSPVRGDVLRRKSTAKRIGTRSSTMAVKALRLLQPGKGANEGKGNHSGQEGTKPTHWDQYGCDQFCCDSPRRLWSA